MKLLLDTHVVLWAAADAERLSLETREAIEDGANEVLVSAVTAWEIAIKQSLGKLTLDRVAERWLPDVIKRLGFESLTVDFDAALRVRNLPFHHRDPFDRLIIAQAMHEGLTVVTRDEIFSAYEIATMRA